LIAAQSDPDDPVFLALGHLLGVVHPLDAPLGGTPGMERLGREVGRILFYDGCGQVPQILSLGGGIGDELKGRVAQVHQANSCMMACSSSLPMVKSWVTMGSSR